MVINLNTAGPLSLSVYNPGMDAVFQVTSTLILGREEAILVDAQFAGEDARALADLVRASGRELDAIYISHGDPDYYFGLDVLREAFPKGRVLASQATIDHIWSTRDNKLKVWGPKLGENAPKHIVMPDLAPCKGLELEGRELKIIGLDGPTPDRTFLWIPAAGAVVGGIPVMYGEHVWMADTQTPESHVHWLETLERIRELRPEIVVPGHCSPGSPCTLEAVDFTADYIRAYDEETARASDSTSLIAAMQKRFPGIGGLANLELSAKVSMGEMHWE